MVNDHARQFMPFSPLKGYYELIKEREKILVDRRELSEDAAELLSQKLNRVEKGMMLKAVYYSNGEYVSKEGMVSQFDEIFHSLTIVKTKIDFEDLLDISGEKIV